MKQFFALFLVCGLAGALASPLYAPAPPPDSAFLRLVNATMVVSQVAIGSVVFPLPWAETTKYRVVKEGSRVLRVGINNTSVQLEAGNFYTAVLFAGKWWLNLDRTHSSLLQARIAVYNASSLGVAIKTADGQLSLWEKLETKTYQMRAVNAVKVRLAVFVGEKKWLLPETQLEANMAYSIFIFGDAKNFKAIWLRNTTEVL